MSDLHIDLKDFRQPLVTSLGVILGFLLGFLGQWITEEFFALKTASDIITFIGCIVGATLLIFALYRMLSTGITSDKALAYYRHTLNIYMAGIVIPLICIILSAFI